MSAANFYGDNVRWFIGRVAANTSSDPTQTGRIKVRIFGIHDSELITDADLPWAQVLMPGIFGGGSGLSPGSRIEAQTLVFGIFLDGNDSQLPLVIGSVPTRETLVTPQYRYGDTENKIDETTVFSDAENEQFSTYGFDENAEGGMANPGPDNYSGTRGADVLFGQDNLERAWYWFRSVKGGDYSAEATAGLLGNFWIESGPPAGGLPDDINPAARNDTDEQSFGIAQWNPFNGGNRAYINPKSRLAKLNAFVADLGGDMQVEWLLPQLMFVTYELEHDPLHGCSAELHSATTPEEAARIVEVHYEKPEFYDKPNHPRSSSFSRRKAARNIYKRFTGTD